MRDRFPPEVANKLEYYVYRLIDPRNGEIFYVGKGRGDRIFFFGAPLATLEHAFCPPNDYGFCRAVEDVSRRNKPNGVCCPFFPITIRHALPHITFRNNLICLLTLETPSMRE